MSKRQRRINKLIIIDILINNWKKRDEFNIIACLVGILKGIPTVGLNLLLAWLLVKWEFKLKEKGMSRLLRLIILLIVGSVSTFIIVAVSYPYGFKFHGMVFGVMVPFVLFCYVQVLRYLLRVYGLRSGNPEVNKRWLISGIVTALLLVGCYVPEAGIVSHGVLCIGVGIGFAASFNYVIFFSNADGFQSERRVIFSEIVEDIVWVAIGGFLMWYCYTSINEWEYNPTNIINSESHINTD